MEAFRRLCLSCLGHDRGADKLSVPESRDCPLVVRIVWILAALAIGFGGVVEWRGQENFKVTVAALKPCGDRACDRPPNPALAFEYNWRAYRANPWDWLIRYQLMLTFMDFDSVLPVEIDRHALLAHSFGGKAAH